MTYKGDVVFLGVFLCGVFLCKGLLYVGWYIGGMSGPICQRCGCPYLRSIDESSLGKDPAQCGYCGWKGDVSKSMRAWLTPEMSRKWSERMERLRAGTLVLVRIRVDPKADMTLSMDIMMVLGLDSMSHDVGTDMIVVELERRPSDAQVDRLRSLAGVLGVEVVSDSSA